MRMQARQAGRRACVFVLLAASVVGRALSGEEETFFRERVEPILAKRCLECHGVDRSGGLDLRTKATLRAGGESGVVVRPGKPSESLLVEYVESETMPPEHPLTKQEAATLRQWIERGAFFPDRTLDLYAFSTDRRAGYDWWSLQPVARPSVPRTSSPARHPIDAFLLARLQKEGLTFSPPAEKGELLRRATVDLTGLPPTYEEVQAFASDERPDAWERVVDRLLASPRYAERWARHWLDVVRYAESNGFERDRLRENFWRYRDYVLDVFARDVPFDEFVREQLAADAFAPGDPRALAASGFLVAGPKNDVGTISEFEQKTTRQDELDEFVVATMTTFCGMTVGCARCHDHKFDPIPAKDYYALTAVFSGLDRGEVESATAAERLERNRRLAAIRGKIHQARAEAEKILAPARGRVLASGSAGPLLPSVRAERNQDDFEPVAARFVRFTARKTNTGGEPCLDEFEVYGPGGEQNLALASAGAKASASSLLPGFAIHKVEHLNDDRIGNSFSWISNEPGRGWAVIELAAVATIDRVVWSRDREGKFQDRLPTEYSIAVSTDGKAWREVSGSQRRAPADGDAKARQKLDAEAIRALSDHEREEYARWAAELTRREAELKKVPPLPTVYAAKDGPPAPAFLLRRGDVREPMEPAAPAALSAVRMLPTNLVDPKRDSGTERRRRLAEWIVDPRNPLTARVIVNRIWHWHFGQGIVSTPSDFGFNGDRPSHPELLDWLAADFVDHGWRIKRLHRQIVLSDAYRQTSRANGPSVEKDGANRLLGRMNPRRLEAEAVRDAILFVAGTLDLKIGGPSYRLFRYRDGNVPDYILLPRSGPETWRRSMYAFSIRTFREPLLAAFDCPDPSVQTPKREVSTTALQALSLLNNPFLVEQAAHFAKRIERTAGPSLENQVTMVFRTALAREPEDAERAAALAFAREHGLAALGRVILNTSEFLHVP